MIEVLALVVVVLTGLYFIALGAISLFIPVLASRFLLGFADSAIKHFAELSLRFLAGCALTLYAPQMLFPDIFTLFSWVLLVTTAFLFLVPWRWHHRFAQQAVPKATRHTTLIGLVSLALGGFILAAVVRGSAA
ncbi:hypothetical protein N800_11085 [Lysobacter daejeonensis GH1-9]|uniref:DUF4149 domain-containing protein n=1 Tax=Lysobacter daejeonensis GH1-9 TaxID=1385517 RepID=A0A0A0EQ56_9GAMM|nr:hypothetical protein [Lysobacter daejeonensis]KGM53126.1 hypothetical protein N800_11085 [Lysobacter daejeonensis GH1-9]